MLATSEYTIRDLHRGANRARKQRSTKKRCRENASGNARVRVLMEREKGIEIEEATREERRGERERVGRHDRRDEQQ